VIRIPCGDLTNEVDEHCFPRETVEHSHHVHILGHEMCDKKIGLNLMNVAGLFVDVH
jgi:hypothetical protein